MKQTIRTKNYTTTIEIPYQKLASKHRCIPLESLQQCSKTLTIETCQHQQNISIKMLEELEQAFENDMKAKADIIEGLVRRVSVLEEQLSWERNQCQRYRKMLVESDQRYLQAIKALKNSEQKLNDTLSMLRIKQNRVIVLQNSQQTLQKRVEELNRKNINLQGYVGQIRQKLAVAEFKNSTFSNQIQQLAESLQKVTKSCESYENQLKQAQITISGQQSELLRKQEELRNYEVSLHNKEQKIRNKSTKIQELSSLRIKIEAQIEQLHERLDQKNRKINEIVQENQKLQLNIVQLKSQLLKKDDVCEILSDRLTKISQLNVILDSNIRSLETYHKDLTFQFNNLSQETTSLGDSNRILVKKIVERQKEIQILQEQLRNKEQPQNYEIRIEKVIDRQQYIRQLENRLGEMRSNQSNQEWKVREVQSQLQAKSLQINEKQKIIEDLQINISKLKSYVSSKEQSLAWVVEREIGKDIHANQDPHPPIYRVYPVSSQHNFNHSERMSNFGYTNTPSQINQVDSNSILNQINKNKFTNLILEQDSQK